MHMPCAHIQRYDLPRFRISRSKLINFLIQNDRNEEKKSFVCNFVFKFEIYVVNVVGTFYSQQPTLLNTGSRKAVEYQELHHYVDIEIQI